MKNKSYVEYVVTITRRVPLLRKPTEEEIVELKEYLYEAPDDLIDWGTEEEWDSNLIESNVYVEGINC